MLATTPQRPDADGSDAPPPASAPRPPTPAALALRVRLARLRNHEWWPTWACYLPVALAFPFFALRRRSLRCWTCVNPGIPHGGGIVGEDKLAILRALNAAGDPASPVLPAVPLPEAPDRAEAARRLVAERPELGGYPVILKPSAGQRGAAVRLVRTREDFPRALAGLRGPAILQRYHPGPHEVGVFWIRGLRPREEAERGREGSIFAVTRKHFPRVTGDGRRTLAQLIDADPRLRVQRGVFLARLGERAAAVPAAGEPVRIGEAGNHAQGSMFTDGSDLITPELEAAIDRLAAGFRAPTPPPTPPPTPHPTPHPAPLHPIPHRPNPAPGLPFDFGRFDLRYVSDEALRAGTGFGVVELNGTTSEPTNMYDPSRSVFFAWRLLLGAWSNLFRLGRRRLDEGHRPLPWRTLLALASARSKQNGGVAD